MCLIFGALFVGWLWSCEEVQPLKMRSQKPRYLGQLQHCFHGRDAEEQRHFPCLISRLWGRQVVCKSAKLLGRDYHCASFIFAVSIWQLGQAFSYIRRLKRRQLSRFIKSSLHRGSHSAVHFIDLACPFVAFLQMFLSSGRTICMYEVSY